MQKNMQRAMNKLKQNGVIPKEKKLTLKSFRHTFGIINVHLTGNIYKAMEMLNHKRLETTQEYLDMPDYLLAQEFPELKHLVDNTKTFQGEAIPQSNNAISPHSPSKMGDYGHDSMDT